VYASSPLAAERLNRIEFVAGGRLSGSSSCEGSLFIIPTQGEKGCPNRSQSGRHSIAASAIELSCLSEHSGLFCASWPPYARVADVVSCPVAIRQALPAAACWPAFPPPPRNVGPCRVHGAEVGSARGFATWASWFPAAIRPVLPQPVGVGTLAAIERRRFWTDFQCGSPFAIWVILFGMSALSPFPPTVAPRSPVLHARVELAR